MVDNRRRDTMTVEITVRDGVTDAQDLTTDEWQEVARARGRPPKRGRPAEAEHVGTSLERIDARLAELRRPEEEAAAEAEKRRTEINRLEKARKIARRHYARERAALLEDEASTVWDEAEAIQSDLLRRLADVHAELALLETARLRWLDAKLEAAALRDGQCSPFARQALAREFRPGGRLPDDVTREDVRGFLGLLMVVDMSFLGVRADGSPRRVEFGQINAGEGGSP
jgi:hypothetical protein